MSATLSELEEIARRCRIEIVNMVYRAQAGHPGGSLSEIDLIAALYSTSLRVRPDEPDWEDRDRFILSKGHASPGMYALLAEKGFIQHEDLHSYRVLGGICQGHVDMKWCPGVDFSAGSLGMGLSFGMGCALAARIDGSERRAFVMLGDGEIQEGSVWEAAMAATHHELGNLKVILDRNRIQNDDFCESQMRMFDIPAKWKAFGWETLKCNGNDLAEMVNCLNEAKKLTGNGKPIMIIMKTEMGFGVDYMMGSHKWHGVAPNDEQLKVALDQLEETIGDY